MGGGGTNQGASGDGGKGSKDDVDTETAAQAAEATEATEATQGSAARGVPRRLRCGALLETGQRQPASNVTSTDGCSCTRRTSSARASLASSPRVHVLPVR